MFSLVHGIIYVIHRSPTSRCLACQSALDRLSSCVVPVILGRIVLAYTSSSIASIKIRHVTQYE